MIHRLEHFSKSRKIMGKGRESSCSRISVRKKLCTQLLRRFKLQQQLDCLCCLQESRSRWIPMSTRTTVMSAAATGSPGTPTLAAQISSVHSKFSEVDCQGVMKITTWPRLLCFQMNLLWSSQPLDFRFPFSYQQGVSAGQGTTRRCDSAWHQPFEEALTEMSNM